MPSYTRGKERQTTTLVPVNPSILYGFKTKDFSAISNISNSDLTTVLGHLIIQPGAANSALGSGQISVFGCNSPKPARASVRINAPTAQNIQERVSTFCAYNKVDTAVNNGWSVTPGREPGVRTEGKTVTAIVPIGNLLYIFPMNKEDFTNYKDVLGLQGPETITSDLERNRLVRGTRKPRPLKVKRRLQTGSTLTSFADPNKRDELLRAGWDVVRPALL